MDEVSTYATGRPRATARASIARSSRWTILPIPLWMREQLRKGEVWINGRPLGRFWNIGPQRTLYLPAPWLKKGRNEIVVFDLKGRTGRTVPFLAKAILDENE